MNPSPARRSVITAVLTGTISLAGSVLAGELPAPGLYEVATTTHFSDGIMPDTTVTTQNCLTAEDLERDPASVFAGLPEGRSCSVDQFVMEDGVIAMQISCEAPEGDMRMTVDGSYEDETYRMVSDVLVTVGDEAVTMHSTIDGKRVGAC
jgi:hypothetical protein